LAIEEISRGDAGLGITLEAAVGLGISPLLRFGSDAQQQKYLPELAAGRRLWAFGLTEPHAGSDAGSTNTRGRLEGDEWVINGSKAFITNPGTDISWGVTVTAVTGQKGGEGKPEISTIIVEKGTPGYLIDPPYRKLGWHSSDTHGLAFHDCHVPEDNLLGERGRGYGQFLSTLEAGRIAIAALSVGLAQACLDESLTYARERVSFGMPLSKHQAIQFKLADMAMEVHLSRLATYHAANLWERGRPCAMEAASAKLFASEASKRACDQAVQIHGGMGFMEASPVARFWRDVKANEIGEGTSMEVHLSRLATYHAANLWERGRPCAMEAASAKLFASEASKRACDQAVQIHGGMGFMEASPVARFWRDVKANEIGEGTSEVQRMLLAKHLGC